MDCLREERGLSRRLESEGRRGTLELEEADEEVDKRRQICL
jgi:hypothetical protein